MGVLNRLILRKDPWRPMPRHIIGDESTRGSSGRDDRMFVDAVLGILPTGSSGRDLPDKRGDAPQADALIDDPAAILVTADAAHDATPLRSCSTPCGTLRLNEASSIPAKVTGRIRVNRSGKARAVFAGRGSKDGDHRPFDGRIMRRRSVARAGDPRK